MLPVRHRQPPRRRDVIVRTSGRDQIRMGDTVHVTADPPHAIHLFDKATGARVG